jgi:acetyltransferase-like isoleucine patch superfamily enzyme
MTIAKIIESIVLRIGKHNSYSFNQGMNSREIMAFGLHLTSWFIRGISLKLRAKHTKGLVLVGSQVKIRYANNLRAGRNLIIEDGVEVMALSKNGISLGDNVTLGAMSTIKPSNYYGHNIGIGLTMGNNSNIGRYSYIGCSGGINIGSNVMISPRVSMYAENHVFDNIHIPMKQQGVERKEINILDNCWIAGNSVILAGVTIGEGSIVAAGSVVTKDVPPYSIVAGSPAKIISNRKDL